MGFLASSHAFAPFTVSDIHFSGLENLPEDNARRLLTLKAGDRIDLEKSDRLIRALFESGYFQNVEVVEGKHADLIVNVVERPTINDITIDGNKMIKKDQMQKVLDDAGLKRGNVLNEYTLSTFARSMKHEYISQGRHAIEIDIEQIELPRNRVDVKVHINEGKTAKMARIDLLGNQQFSDAKLKDVLSLRLPTMWSYITGSDTYSQSRYQESLKDLADFYLDRGYLDFRVVSSQISLNHHLNEAYLTVSIEEGHQYYLGEIKLTGEFPIAQSTLEGLQHLRRGDLFSKKEVMSVAKALKEALGNAGYAFAEVKPLPEVDQNKRLVTLSFDIQPGRKVMVRDINILGNTITDDEVFRKRMLVLERSTFNLENLERSTIRLQRMPYVTEIKKHVVPVQGVDDEVDINYDITEKSANQIFGALGYSEMNKLFIQTGFQMPNVFGSGNSVNLTLNYSRPEKNVSFVYTQPYFTLDGIAQTVEVYARNVDNSQRDLTNYSTNAYGFNLGYEIPYDLDDFIKVGVGYDHTRMVRPKVLTSRTVDAFVEEHGDEYSSYKAHLGWLRNSVNRAYFPSSGVEAKIGAEATLPGSDLTWYKTYAKSTWYLPMWVDNSAFSITTKVQYGNGYGSEDRLPFFENFYAGGWESVRGFYQGSLGRRDSICPGTSSNCTDSDRLRGSSIGGNLAMSLNMNMYLPVFFAKDTERKRFILFADIGNVYDTYTLTTAHDDNASSSPSFKNLRYSVGVAFAWASPIGNIGFSLAKPFNVKDGDDVKNFQITIGRQF